MRQNRIAQLGIRQLSNHCNLNRGHNFPSIHSEGGKTQDSIAIDLNQRFQESSCLRKRVRSEHCFHGDLEHTVRDAPILSLFLAETYACQLWVGEHTEWHLPAGRNVVPAGDVVADHPEIVKTDVSEHRSARYIADSPNSRRGCLKPLIDLHVSVPCQLDAGHLQADILGVWSATRRDKQMGTFYCFLPAAVSEHNLYV